MSGNHEHTPVIVLAAGCGTRMGTDTDKLLTIVAGRPLLQWTLDLIGAGRTVIIAVRPQRDRRIDGIAARADASVVECPNAGSGVAWTLHDVESAVTTPDVAIIPGDDPLCALALDAVLDASRSTDVRPIAVRRDGGTPHPVLVSTDQLAAFARTVSAGTVEADRGMHTLLGNATAWITAPVRDPVDVDTAADVARLEARLEPLA